MNMNELGQPVGEPVDWAGARPPARQSLGQGRFCSLEPLDVREHGSALYAAQALDETGANWTYLPHAAPASEREYLSRLTEQQHSNDPLFFAVLSPVGEPLGSASYLRIQPQLGSIEVGYIHFTLRMQRGPLSTEAMFLMMRHAFVDLGYRRYEWKCDSLNAPSRKAAQRLGFTFEGIFRQDRVVKGRNRDTAWYSILDKEWPVLDRAFQKWLAPENFDEQGQQLRRLEDYR
jgi:RimJ/RimL family protein N-acetyltransferase